MLPYCPDDQLLDELSTVVRAGWDLPLRPHLESGVRHILQLANIHQAESYSVMAERLLKLMDTGLEKAMDDLDVPVVSDEEYRGLRILFGLHPD